MELTFTDEAIQDLQHLKDFLYSAQVHQPHKIINDLISALEKLTDFPLMGVRVNQPTSQDIRDYFPLNYSVRYLVQENIIVILRIWHQRENERST